MVFNLGMFSSITDSIRHSGARRRSSQTASRRLSVESLELRCLLANHPLTAIPVLNSLSGAPVTIYLDFDGHTESQDWPDLRVDEVEGPIVTPVFDIDNDLTTFSDEELRLISEVWHRVAEDFKPFNVNVSTVNPGSFNNFQAILVSIGGNGSWFEDAGGVAFLNAFSNASSNTCYVFPENLGKGTNGFAKNIALTASHEAGHTFGLNHHSIYNATGTKLDEYHPGTAALGPIMGAPFNSVRETWNDGPANVSVTALQDDLAVLTRSANQTFSYRVDDFGSTTSNANTPTVTSGSFRVEGIVERNNDQDWFRFETATGNVTFNATGLDVNTIFTGLNVTPGTNLDVTLSIYNASGTLVTTAAPTDSLKASISTALSGGVYYVSVSGGSEYGSLGAYTLTGTVNPVPSVPTMVQPTGTISDVTPTLEWTIGANAVSYQVEVQQLLGGTYTNVYTATVEGVRQEVPTALSEGTFRARVRSNTAGGIASDWSEFISFTIDVPIPGEPEMVRPLNGDITTSSRPAFEWTSVTSASEYSLEVYQIITGVGGAETSVIVINRTRQTGLTYQHFTPLPDGVYTARVRATNESGEDGEFSNTVRFTVNAPAPVAPRITAPTTPTASTSPRIVWTESNDAVYYELWVNNRTTGVTRQIFEQIADQTFYDTSGLTQGTYVAWVRAFNISNEASPWSVGYTFVVDIPAPGRPTLLTPTGTASSGVVVTRTPTFRWTAATRAESYDLWVNNETTRQIQIIRTQITRTGNATAPATSFTSPSRLPDGVYRVWVRAVNSVGEPGAWSAVQSFTLDAPALVAPTFVNPGGVNLYTTLTPTIRWTPSTSTGEFYDLWINNLTLNIAQFVRVPNITGTSYTIPETMKFRNNDQFVAFIRTGDSLGDFSPWTPSNAGFRFRIAVPRPVTPVLTAPPQVVRTSRPTFTWSHTSSNTKYTLLIRDLENSESIPRGIPADGITVTPSSQSATSVSYTLPASMSLAKGTYRVWVQAINSIGEKSAWSSAITFVISLTSVDTDDLNNGMQPLAGQLADPQPVRSDSTILTMAEVTAGDIAVAGLYMAADAVTTSDDVMTDPVVDQSREFIGQSVDLGILPTDMAFLDGISSDQVMGEFADPASGMGSALLNSVNAETDAGEASAKTRLTRMSPARVVSSLFSALIPVALVRTQRNRDDVE